MKIIVLDNNGSRHKKHEKEITRLFLGASYDIIEKFSKYSIDDCNVDILLVHQGNIEFPDIEDSQDCGLTRIFFSGGTDTYEKIDGDHYVPFDELYDRMEKILSEMSGSDDS
jgi:hypothetical protein